MIGWRHYSRPSRGNPHARDLGAEFMIGPIAIPGEAIMWVIMYFAICGIITGFVGLIAAFIWWIERPL